MDGMDRMDMKNLGELNQGFLTHQVDATLNLKCTLTWLATVEKIIAKLAQYLKSAWHSSYMLVYIDALTTSLLGFAPSISTLR